MSDFLVTLTLVTALGCALSAGALFAFSSFVIKALARLPDPQSIAAMQSINVQAVTPVFMTALFGTGLACLALASWRSQTGTTCTALTSWSAVGCTCSACPG
jgi:uncharacterized membrane protein